MTSSIWTPPPGTTGLIFDCDGTLADTMPAHYKAWTAMLGRYGIPFPEPRFYAMGGMPTAQIIRVLAADAGVTVTDVDAMVHEKEQAFLTHLDAVTVDRAGARASRRRIAASCRSPSPAAATATRSRARSTASPSATGSTRWWSPRTRRDTSRSRTCSWKRPGGSASPRPDAWCSRTPTSAWKPPAARG